MNPVPGSVLYRTRRYPDISHPSSFHHHLVRPRFQFGKLVGWSSWSDLWALFRDPTRHDRTYTQALFRRPILPFSGQFCIRATLSRDLHPIRPHRLALQYQTTCPARRIWYHVHRLYDSNSGYHSWGEDCNRCNRARSISHRCFLCHPYASLQQEKSALW